jgi:hypothetical protein
MAYRERWLPWPGHSPAIQPASRQDGGGPRAVSAKVCALLRPEPRQNNTSERNDDSKKSHFAPMCQETFLEACSNVILSP